MTFKMKVEDLFVIGERTVFAGKLETDALFIKDVPCLIEVDGEAVGKLRIQGEVLAGKPRRDLWTTSQVDVSVETVREKDVWLISI